MLDLVELFTHWHAGRSQVQLSESLGIDRKTVRKYLAPAVAAGIVGAALGSDTAAKQAFGEDYATRPNFWRTE